MKITFNRALIPFFAISLSLIFMSMPPYYDDVVRFSSDVTRLSDQGRFLTEFIYRVIGFYKFNFFPNTYLANLIFIASIISMSYFFLIKKNNSNSEGVLCLMFLMIISSHGILQNYAFHVDSIGMFTSILLSLLAASSYSKNKIITVITSSLFLTIATFFYQVSFNVFIFAVPVFAFIDEFYRKGENTKNRNINFILSKVISLLITILIVMFFTKKYAHDAYFLEHSKFLSVSWFHEIGKTFNLLINATYGSFSSIEILSIIIISAFCFPMHIHFIYKAIKNRLFMCVFLYISILICSLVSFFLPILALENPVIEQRVLLPFYFILFFITLPIAIYFNKSKFFYIVLIFPIINVITASSFVTSQIYATNMTKDFMREIYLSIPSNMKNINGSATVNLIKGKRIIPINEHRNNSKYFPSLNYLTMTYMSTEYQINGLVKYFSIPLTVNIIDKEPEGATIITNNYNYSIIENSGSLYVLFNN